MEIAEIGFSEEQPTTGGYWLWIEAGNTRPVRLLLTDSGDEVACCDDAIEGTHQYYWEQTSTNQRSMPGQWKRDEDQSAQ